MGGQLYRTVYEAFSALRAEVPDDHKEAPLRREAQGICVLTAAFNEYRTSYPYHHALVPSEAKIRMMRRAINQFIPFVQIFENKRKDKRLKKIESEEETLYNQLQAYVSELKTDESRTAHVKRWDVYALSLRIALSAPSIDQPAFHIGRITDEALQQAYADHGLIKGEEVDMGNKALVMEYTFFERVLRRVYTEVCVR